MIPRDVRPTTRALPPSLGDTPFRNSFEEAFNPETLGTADQGTQLKNVGRARALYTLVPGDDIQAALDKASSIGGGSIILRAGEYFPNGALVIPDYVSLYGEGSAVTILDFSSAGGAPRAISAQGGLVTETGTITVTQNSTTVTGSSTAFPALQPGWTFYIYGVPYTIAARSSLTDLTLTETYRGPTRAGVTSWAIVAAKHDISLGGITVKNAAGASSTQSVRFNYVENLDIEDVIVSDTIYDGFEITNCINWRIAKCVARDITDQASEACGFLITASVEVSYGRMNDCHAYRIKADTDGERAGFFFVGDLSRTSVEDCTSISNKGSGFEITSADNLTLSNCLAEQNTGSGFVLSSNANEINMSFCRAYGNGAHGFNITGSTCNDAHLIGCYASGNLASLQDLGTNTKQAANTFA